jgi:hypothetical protein
MRTKTLALSALLGLLGSASVMAQSVYSINSVGYINTTFAPGTFSLLTCPLIASPDNTLNTLMPDTNGQYKHAIVYSFSGGIYTVEEIGVALGANASGWSGGGADIALTPGTACFFYNSTTAAMSATFVGTVPQNSTPISAQLPNGLTNFLTPGLNLVGSIVPSSGDITTNIMSFTNQNKHDYVYTYDATNGGFSSQLIVVAPGVGTGYNNEWLGGDPVLDQVSYGFYYWNNKSTNLNWVENFSINP